MISSEEEIMESVTLLRQVLKEHFIINAARIMLIAQMVVALIKVRTVCLSEIATGFAGNAMPSSNEKRIHRFLRDFPFDSDAVALFVGSKLPEGKWLLTLDRTNWKFGRTDINILMLAVVYKGVAVPLMWKILGKEDVPNFGKKGNSNTGERKELTDRLIRLFGAERAEALIADREFIGNEWFCWLKEQGVRIIIRLRESQYVTGSRGIPTRASFLFRNLKIKESRILRGLRKIGNAELFVCGMKLPGCGLLIVASSDNPEDALEIYARRWQIETMFACLKTRGFRFESTHLANLERIGKLLGIVVIAFVWAYLVGDWLNGKKPLAIKNHGYRARSIFRYGPDYLRHIFLGINDHVEKLPDLIRFLSPKYFFNSS